MYWRVLSAWHLRGMVRELVGFLVCCERIMGAVWIGVCFVFVLVDGVDGYCEPDYRTTGLAFELSGPLRFFSLPSHPSRTRSPSLYHRTCSRCCNSPLPPTLPLTSQQWMPCKCSRPSMRSLRMGGFFFSPTVASLGARIEV